MGLSSQSETFASHLIKTQITRLLAITEHHCRFYHFIATANFFLSPKKPSHVSISNILRNNLHICVVGCVGCLSAVCQTDMPGYKFLNSLATQKAFKTPLHLCTAKQRWFLLCPLVIVWHIKASTGPVIQSEEKVYGPVVRHKEQQFTSTRRAATLK